MPNTALNRTTAALLTNKSGGALTYGAVVVLDNTNASGFTTTTTAGLSTRGIGVILEPNGIANDASGMVAIGGWCPRINLNTASTIGQFIKTHTVAGQGTPHSSPQVEGDFAVALTASANPSAILFGSANAGSVGDVTDYQVINKTADESVTSSTTLQSDDELNAAIGTSGTWLITWTLAVNGATAGDIKVALNVPASATGRVHMVGLATTASGPTGDLTTFSTTDLTDTGVGSFGAATTSFDVTLILKAVVVSGGTGGNVVLRWAQNTSSGTATIIRAGSILESLKVA